MYSGGSISPLVKPALFCRKSVIMKNLQTMISNFMNHISKYLSLYIFRSISSKKVTVKKFLLKSEVFATTVMHTTLPFTL